jgi:hypothetical protein
VYVTIEYDYKVKSPMLYGVCGPTILVRAEAVSRSERVR